MVNYHSALIPLTAFLVRVQMQPRKLHHLVLHLVQNKRLLISKRLFSPYQEPKSLPKVKIIYLYIEFKSALLGFVDDVEFYLDRNANVIQVRSASDLGESDLGVNRQGIEAIRAKLK